MSVFREREGPDSTNLRNDKRLYEVWQGSNVSLIHLSFLLYIYIICICSLESTSADWNWSECFRLTVWFGIANHWKMTLTIVIDLIPCGKICLVMEKSFFLGRIQRFIYLVPISNLCTFFLQFIPFFFSSIGCAANQTVIYSIHTPSHLMMFLREFGWYIGTFRWMKDLKN